MLKAASENSSYGNIPALPSLKYLNISSSAIAGGWLTKILPHLWSLETLNLSHCLQIKWLSISQPTETEGSSNLVSAVALSSEDQTLFKVPSNILCSLKHLAISRCVDLEFYGGKGGFGGFATLEKLEISECPNLSYSLLMSGTEDDDTSNMDVALLPPSVKKLGISGCPMLVLLSARDTKDDTSNVDVGLLPPSLEVLSLSNLPENFQSYFPKGLAYLKYLNLMDSPCLKCVQLHSCTALRELRICRCGQLGALEGLQFVTSLRRLTISKCQQLGALEGLQFLTSLRSMKIEMNPKLSSAWDRNPKLQEQEQGENQIGLLPLSIKKLEIPNLTDNVQPRLMSCLPAMTTKLVIQESSELTSLHLGHCTALRKLEIKDCESLALIEGFQSITNLMSFTVAAFSCLPPWMELLLQQQEAYEILSRLTNLEIGDASILTVSLCKQLTSLQYLEFNGKKRARW
jgi:hypothetical protein